jgi:hypothetical protein
MEALMASGFKEVVFNTLEEVISPDLNRSQKFKGADIAEMMRYMVDVSGGTDDLDSGGVTTEYASLESPMRVEIMNGFLVKPALADVRLAIDPGVLFALSPDGAPDDSNYKYIHDIGIGLNSSLTIAANASGLPRVDIIGATITFTTPEVDNRNIFNPTSGLFAPTSIPKASQGTLTYSVLQGTPGSGLPTPAAGFLPLCVAYIPNGSTNNDACSFWDVRPLINDRAFGNANLDTFTSRLTRSDYFVDVINSTGHAWLSGLAEGVLRGRRVGGVLQAGGPLAVQTAPGGLGQTYGLDLTDNHNAENGFTTVTSGIAFLYFAFPGGLPRWARYTTAASGVRKPAGPRGIVTMSNKAPSNPITCTPSSAISVQQFNAATLNALCFGVFGWNSSTNISPTLMADKKVWVDQAAVLPFVSYTGSGLSQVAQFTLALGSNAIPANARSIIVLFSMQIANTSGAPVPASMTRDIVVTDNSGARVANFLDGTAQVQIPTANTYPFFYEVEIPLPYLMPSLTGAPTGLVQWNLSAFVGNGVNGTTVVASNFVATIKGYRLA